MLNIKKNYQLLSSSQIETDLGKQIREIRLSRNISQKQLATLAGISSSSIYRFESGNGISLDNFIRILKGLGLEMVWQQLSRQLFKGYLF